MVRGKLTIISCDSGKYFADKIALEITKFRAEQEIRHVNMKEETFANGEIKVVIEKSVRGDDVFIVQCVENPHHPKSINDRIMAMFCAIDAARRAGAAFVNLIVPTYPYARQEKKKSREPITASLIANVLESLSLNSIITLDVHADAITGFFQVTDFINLFAANTIMRYLNANYSGAINNLVVVSPDTGGAPRARFYARKLGAELAMMNKERDYSTVNVVEKVTLIGSVKGKNVLLVDDIIDTGGTIVGVIDELKKHGANEVLVATTFPLMNGKCIDKFKELFDRGSLKAVVGTDAVYHNEKFFELYPWYKEVSLAPLFAKVINTINLRKPISDVIGKR
ncbi:ribose-phosphate pyrophosphokinase [Candidatus Woesearchaeota archaeon]|jgi:ribose-phosphate pyrophosphokinase|nr:ribose-phosphate pyrophosphokinase [Candidatus Woesearchaeota archaeon]MBT5272392.1 ribose-phosphate pyrophosphokinase [Candidatus Woesearchaeota archaeon]MBT6041003.1 ribose-phosphate pyrophosphokinase [Candidatus Woesearchaeota archaeon]MBT6336664.1 ribose-phosphate pyrophosphokinase [Candidatus Woesearchaeota archaeon]MBT7927554.1 ribose-phosphate pyrophosphokinase [Candidatus Woesearchaeota archaeon]